MNRYRPSTRLNKVLEHTFLNYAFLVFLSIVITLGNWGFQRAMIAVINHFAVSEILIPLIVLSLICLGLILYIKSNVMKNKSAFLFMLPLMLWSQAIALLLGFYNIIGLNSMPAVFVGVFLVVIVLDVIRRLGVRK